MKKIFWIIVVVVVAATVLLVLRYKAPQASAPSAPSALSGDNTAAITSDLGSIDVGAIDQEFQAIDQDLKSL